MPSVSEIIILLGKTPLFGALSMTDMSRVALEMSERTYASGQQIFGRGDPGNEVFLVVTGRVRLSIFSADGRALSFRHCNDGELFGEIAALDGGARTADATALTPTRALVLSRSALLRILTANPGVAQSAIEFLCRRLRDTSEQLEKVVLSSVEVRLAKFIWHLYKQRAVPATGARVIIDLGTPQGELALLLGATRQSVNIALTALEKGGVIKRTDHGLDCDLARLMQAAAQD